MKNTNTVENLNGKVTNTVIIALIIFNVFFPKGGIKIGDVPITIGMSLLMFVLFYRIVKSILSFSFMQISVERMTVLLGWMPFQVWVLVCIANLDINDFGAVLSMGFNFIFLPVALLFFEGKHFSKIDKMIFFKWIRYGVLFVAVFGIIAFVYKLNTGDFVEIPFLTVNYSDYGNLDEKNINRGLVSKLISTYQNGNIYGVCILMLLPMYCYFEEKKIFRLIVKFSLLLTLSRTVWVGLIAYEILYAFYLRPSAKRKVAMLFILVIFLIAIFYLINLIGADIDFLSDGNLGGRMPKLEIVKYTILPNGPIESIMEIVYAGMIYNYGIIGLIFFLVAVVSPIVGWWISGNRSSMIKKTLLCGYLIYLLVAGSDGAILLIPVMIFYWFIVLMMLDR